MNTIFMYFRHIIAEHLAFHLKLVFVKEDLYYIIGKASCFQELLAFCLPTRARIHDFESGGGGERT